MKESSLRAIGKTAIRKVVEEALTKTDGNVTQAASILGIHRNLVYRHLGDAPHGVFEVVLGGGDDADRRPRLRPHAVTTADRARMVEMRLEGRTLLDIASSLGTTPNTVKAHLRADAEEAEST